MTVTEPITTISRSHSQIRSSVPLVIDPNSTQTPALQPGPTGFAPGTARRIPSTDAAAPARRPCPPGGCRRLHLPHVTVCREVSSCGSCGEEAVLFGSPERIVVMLPGETSAAVPDHVVGHGLLSTRQTRLDHRRHVKPLQTGRALRQHGVELPLVVRRTTLSGPWRLRIHHDSAPA